MRTRSGVAKSRAASVRRCQAGSVQVLGFQRGAARFTWIGDPKSLSSVDSRGPVKLEVENHAHLAQQPAAAAAAAVALDALGQRSLPLVETSGNDLTDRLSGVRTLLEETG